MVLAVLLIAGWVGWYLMLGARGWLTPGNALPLNLCDWAQGALIVALLSRNQRAYELGYFWGLGGTLQGVITPDVGQRFSGYSVSSLHARSCRSYRRAALSDMGHAAAGR